MEAIEAPSLAEIVAARDRIATVAVRTPLVPLEVDGAPGRVFLKLENLQPIGSFKVRGAGNAMAVMAERGALDRVYTASAGNMAQGVGYVAQRRGIAWSAVVPDHAPRTKLEAIERLGGSIVKLPFDRWWQVLVEHHFDGLDGAFIHPVANHDVICGNATIGVEILEDLPDVDTIIVPYGGGGLSSGIAAAVRARGSDAAVLACEVETAAPLSASLAAGSPTSVDYQASFVDGMGSSAVLPEMWPLASSLLSGSIVVSLREVANAIRLLVEGARVVAEGAGAASLAAALTGRAGSGNIVCVVSGGNLDAGKLAEILRGDDPTR